MVVYPIMLDLRGRRAVVVGGGEVGLRKVASLLAAGAEVSLVSLEVSAAARELARQGVLILQKSYHASFLEGATVVFACTSDRALNAQIAEDARWSGALVNAADQPDDCDFYLPAAAVKGSVVVAVSTGGESPAFAAYLRDRLEQALPPQAAAFADCLGRIRRELRDRPLEPRRRMEIMRRLSGQAGLELFAREGEEGIRKNLQSLLE